LRIGGRQCGLAEHVVRVTKALRLERLRVRQCLCHGLARDELLAHQAHGHVHALADQRLAAACDQAAQRAGQSLLAVGGHQLARQHQPPGRRIDEDRRTLPHMAAPIAVADLVADQGIARGAVGYTQQGLGQAHQGDAFLRRQGELLQQTLHEAGLARCRPACTQRLHEVRGQGLGARGNGRRQARFFEKVGHGLRLGLAPGLRDALAQSAVRSQGRDGHEAAGDRGGRRRIGGKRAVRVHDRPRGERWIEDLTMLPEWMVNNSLYFVNSVVNNPA